MTQNSRERLSPEAAQDESLALKKFIQRNPEASRAFLNQVSKISDADESVLHAMVAHPEKFGGDNEHDFEQVRNTAKMALEVKKDPKLLIELIKDPNHPRMLDFFSLFMRASEERKPEDHKLVLEEAGIEARLITALDGKEKLQELLHRVHTTYQDLQKNREPYPAVMKGVGLYDLSIIILKGDPQYAHLSPMVWGDLLSLRAIQAQYSQ